MFCSNNDLLEITWFPSYYRQCMTITILLGFSVELYTPTLNELTAVGYFPVFNSRCFARKGLILKEGWQEGVPQPLNCFVTKAVLIFVVVPANNCCYWRTTLEIQWNGCRSNIIRVIEGACAPLCCLSTTLPSPAPRVVFFERHNIVGRGILPPLFCKDSPIFFLLLIHLRKSSPSFWLFFSTYRICQVKAER